MNNKNEVIKSYKQGAEQLLQKLKNWEINSKNAQKQERDARQLWLEDATNLGINTEEAVQIWQDEIIDSILSEDPTFL